MALQRNPNEVEALAKQQLGWGLATIYIDPHLDIAVDIALGPPADGLRDLAIVSGIDALAQNLRHELTTALGADRLNVDHGFDGINALAEPLEGVLLRERIRTAVIRVLRRDDRVARINDVQLVDAGGEPAAAGPLRELRVRADFNTTVGQTAQLSLTRAAIRE